MGKFEDVQVEIGRFLNLMRPNIENLCKRNWNYETDGYFNLLLIAILRRQYDSLDMIVELAGSGKGYICGPLLRPASEELIWTKYLTKLPRYSVERLIACFSHKEMFESLVAQYEYCGSEAFHELNLDPFKEDCESRDPLIRERIRCLAIELDWPKYCKTGKKLPSIRWLAKVTDQMQFYQFMYHATSRLVHFSVHESFRRIWGNPQYMHVSSLYFKNYWGHFAMYWGLRILIDTMVEVISVVNDNPENKNGDDCNEFLEIAKRIGEMGAVPIITSEELQWPQSVLDV